MSGKGNISFWFCKKKCFFKEEKVLYIVNNLKSKKKS